MSSKFSGTLAGLNISYISLELNNGVLGCTVWTDGLIEWNKSCGVRGHGLPFLPIYNSEPLNPFFLLVRPELTLFDVCYLG